MGKYIRYGVQDLVLTFESWYSYFRPFLHNKKNILDIGSGTGVSCILLEKKGYDWIRKSLESGADS